MRETRDAITRRRVLETIIVDAKLSRHTDWTKNQKAAMGMSGWDIKAISDNALLNGPRLVFGENPSLVISGDFLKLYQDGGVLRIQ